MAQPIGRGEQLPNERAATKLCYEIEPAERATIEAVACGDHADPFSYLGMHRRLDDDCLIVRAFLPRASRVYLIEEGSAAAAELTQVGGGGLFCGEIRGRLDTFRYQLREVTDHGERDIEDPYRFPPILDAVELGLFVEGASTRVDKILGAHPSVVDGIDGTVFAVWAPNAKRVSVVGGFNDWDGRRHVMRRRHEAGVWEIFIPGVGCGALYKFEIKTWSDALLPLKTDPYAVSLEGPPAMAAIVGGLAARPQRNEYWPARRPHLNARDAPISIYEVHLGSWRRKFENRSCLSYREIADQLIPYVCDLGFTHIELLPISEYPFGGSWGYQPVGLFAPTSRLGTPDDFRHFVECCHAAGLAVLLDWVPSHFPSDPTGLAYFDGTHLFEHPDFNQRHHPDWNTLVYDFGRPEVTAFLNSNALYWIDEFQIDGLRFDAVASMLYLDYSRAPGKWTANVHGRNENLDAIAFLKNLNQIIDQSFPGVIAIAEESTAWPMVTRPTDKDGLGFHYKWNLGWMHDTLRYMSRNPIHRKFHHNDLTFGLLYAHHENFILALSHDEVVHGKRSLLNRMSGDPWQKFANLRLFYTFMYTQPGKKLLFMGGEFAQWGEWNHDAELHWHLLREPMHRGVQRLIQDLNGLYRRLPALHELDCEPQGFCWIDCDDREHSVLSYIRRGRQPDAWVFVVCNFTPIVRRQYRIGVPQLSLYRELLNSDSRYYGGSDVGNLGSVEAEPVPLHGQMFSVSLTLPPLGSLIFCPEIRQSK